MQLDIAAGLTATEAVALARLAQSPQADPPPHLCPILRQRGWIKSTGDGHHALTAEGRTLVDRIN